MVLAAALAGAYALSGCATITRGTTESLSIQSEPSGAHVELSSGQTGITPCSFELKRKNDLKVFLHKDGFEDVTADVDSKVAGAGATGMAGNVLIGGIIGVGVDAASGATKSLRPNPVHVHLVVRDAADADRLCAAPATVPGAICRGQLKVGATATEVESLLGPPQEKRDSEHEWRYEHDWLVFDEAGRFASTIVDKK
jgi:hypothetical protein